MAANRRKELLSYAKIIAASAAVVILASVGLTFAGLWSFLELDGQGVVITLSSDQLEPVPKQRPSNPLLMSSPPSLFTALSVTMAPSTIAVPVLRHPALNPALNGFSFNGDNGDEISLKWCDYRKTLDYRLTLPQETTVAWSILLASLPPLSPLGPAKSSADKSSIVTIVKPPWRRYAAMAPPFDGRPRIAVVIDDLGINQQQSARVAKLPGPLTTAWLSYANNLAEQTHRARASGHELLIHVPMEPKSSYADPGPGALRTGSNTQQLKVTLENILGCFPAYVGINNHMGSLFTTDPRGMMVVITELKQRGLLWLDSRTDRNSIGALLARQLGVPFVERHVFLDNEDITTHVKEMLRQLEISARQRGYAVGIGHPRNTTLVALQEWLPTLKGKGLVLAPVSSIALQNLTRLAAQRTRAKSKSISTIFSESSMFTDNRTLEGCSAKFEVELK